MNWVESGESVAMVALVVLYALGVIWATFSR